MLEGNRLRVLKIAVVVMGVLIVVGTVAMAVAIANRVAGPSGPNDWVLPLEEPEGSRIVSIVAQDGMLAVLISGGGRPDRIQLIPMRSASRVELVPR